MPKKALITGITGQDGSYLTELLLGKGYDVYGVIRRASTFNTERIDHIYQDPHESGRRMRLLYGDLNDASSLNKILRDVQPDEIYNLGAQSHVRVSFDIPEYTAEVGALGTLRLLEAIRETGLRGTRFYQASCYDVQTRVLTTEGLKTYAEVRAGDLVFTVNTVTNELEVKPVKRVIVSSYTGEMVELRSRRFNLLVTPNHQLLLHGATGLFYSLAGDLRIPDHELFYPRLSSIKFPNPVWRGKRQSRMRLSEVAPCEIPCNATKNLIDEIETNDLFWLVGLYVGDGYFSRDRSALRSGPKAQFIALRDQRGQFVTQPKLEVATYPSHNIYFAIPSSDKSRDRLVKCLKKYGIEYHVNQNWIRCSSYPLGHLLRTCGISAKTKRIPSWMLAYDREHLQALFEGLIGSDGYSRPNRKTYTYTTISNGLVSQVVELCVKLGLRCSTYRKPGKHVLFIRERRTINSSDSYVVQISDNHHERPITLYPSHIGRAPYTGVVWCLEVEDNHNFLVERKGQYAFCGNSSELFGKAQEVPQRETTPFYPRSPYGVAKLYAYWITVNYRESYGLFACNGILFNHESVAGFTPVFCRHRGEMEFDIKPICEIVEFDKTIPRYQSKPVSGIQVWGKDGWGDVSYASAYPHDVERDNKRPRFINARSAAYIATSSHVAFLEGGVEKETGELEIGDRLEAVDLPTPAVRHSLSQEEVELIGMMVGDGSITYAKKGIGLTAKFTNSNPEIRNHFKALWESVTGGTTRFHQSRSGFNPDRPVGQLILAGGADWLRSLDIYTKDHKKRIPKRILNATKETQMAFLKGYNLTDGLKANRCTYEFKNFKTNSATLAMGLWYLIEQTTGQEINLTVEQAADGRLFYSLNLLSPVDRVGKEERVKELIMAGAGQREMERLTGISRTFIRKIQRGGTACQEHHRKRLGSEIKKIIELENYEGWFYDLETSSGEFHCGIGTCHVHNSPRRGETFVTRKITRAAAAIKLGLRNKLYLGNLDARRDWGHAKDFVEAMHLMLQQDEPDDYVIATGETHSVREFLDEAFGHLDLDWKQFVEIDPRYFRPAEVDLLIGDASKARRKLGWEPKITFKELVRTMVEADLADLKRTHNLT